MACKICGMGPKLGIEPKTTSFDITTGSRIAHREVEEGRSDLYYPRLQRPVYSSQWTWKHPFWFGNKLGTRDYPWFYQTNQMTLKSLSSGPFRSGCWGSIENSTEHHKLSAESSTNLSIPVENPNWAFSSHGVRKTVSEEIRQPRPSLQLFQLIAKINVRSLVSAMCMV